MTRWQQSGISLEKFAKTLAGENAQLIREKAIAESAYRADMLLIERGPWGSRDAKSIERHARRQKNDRDITGLPPYPLNGPPASSRFWAEMRRRMPANLWAEIRRRRPPSK